MSSARQGIGTQHQAKSVDLMLPLPRKNFFDQLTAMSAMDLIADWNR
jgi:hypothetical protein